MTECPECGKILRGKQCGCGYKLQVTKADEDKPSTFDALRCQWASSRGRCRLLGQVSRGRGGRFYCTWHHHCSTSIEPIASENIEEFKQFFKHYDGSSFDEKTNQRRFYLSLGNP